MHKKSFTISELVGRNDEHEDKRRRVNLNLADFCREKEIRYVDCTNIDPLKHLNRSHVHLNRSGEINFEDNLFIACKNWLNRPGCSGRLGQKEIDNTLCNTLGNALDNTIVNESTDNDQPNEQDNATACLKNIRFKNSKGLIIAYLNINSIRNKIEFLRQLVSDYVDVLITVETKIDNTFTTSQFVIEGFIKPFRYDRDRHGGGILVYVRERTPIK